MNNFTKAYGRTEVLISMLLVIILTVFTGCGNGNNPPGPAFSNASLHGDYYSSGFNINSGGTSSSIEKIHFDGNGNFTFEQIFGDTNSVNQTQTGSGTFTVNGDGTFTITNNGEIIDGRLSADTKTFVTARVNSKTIHNIGTGVKY